MTLNVLIIDDDEDFTEGLSAILSLKGYKTIVATTAIQGIKLVKENDQSINVILLDLLLPGIDGEICLELLRRDFPDVPIIIISGLDRSTPKAQLALHSGIQAYIKKPFEPNELIESLKEVEKYLKEKKTKSNINIVLIGLDGAGKTALVNRFLHNTFSETISTLGIDLEFYYGEQVQFRLMDLAGQRSFREYLWQQNVRLANAVIFVFDLTTNAENYKEAYDWFWRSVNKWATPDAPILFIGNKSDLKSAANIFDIYKKFHLERLNQTTHSFQIFQTSAKTGENVKAAFEWILEKFERQNVQENCLSSLYIFDKESKELFASYSSLQNNFRKMSVDKKDTVLFSRLIQEDVFDIPPFRERVINYEYKQAIVLSNDQYLLVADGNCNRSKDLIDKLKELFHYISNSIIFIEEQDIRNQRLAWLITSEPDYLVLFEKPRPKLEENDIIIIGAVWSELAGGKVIFNYPLDQDENMINSVISSSFLAKYSIFGFQEVTRPAFLSLPINHNNFTFTARILLDKYPNTKTEEIFSIITLVKSDFKLNVFEYNKLIFQFLGTKKDIKDWEAEEICEFHSLIKRKAIM